MLNHSAHWLLRFLCNLTRPLTRLSARSGYFTPPAADWQPDRAALLCCNWIGDTLWAAQVLPALRRRFPTCHWTVLTKPSCLSLWAGDLKPDTLLSTTEIISDRKREKASIRALVSRSRDLAGQKFDLVIDLTGNRYSALFSFLMRPHHALGPIYVKTPMIGDIQDTNEFSALYSLAAPVPAGEHLAQRPWRIVAPLIGETPYIPYPTISHSSIAESNILSRYGIGQNEKLAVLAPGAGWAQKEWALESFAELGLYLQNKGFRILLIDHPTKRVRCEHLLKMLTASVTNSALCITESKIDTLLSLLPATTVLIGNDSAPGHLAAAYGCLTISIFTGSTMPHLCRPLGRQAFALSPHEGQVPTALDAIHLLNTKMPK